jgi:hypothetical protein
VKEHIQDIDGELVGDGMCSLYQISNFCYYYGDGLSGSASQAGLEKYDAEHKGVAGGFEHFSGRDTPHFSEPKSISAQVNFFFDSVSMMVVVGALVFVSGFM